MRKVLFLLSVAIFFTAKVSALCTVSPCVYSTSGAYTWVVPVGVTSVSIIIEGGAGGGGGGGDCAITRDGQDGTSGGYTTITSTGLSLEVSGGGFGGGSGGGNFIPCGDVASNGPQNGTNIGTGITFIIEGAGGEGNGGPGQNGAVQGGLANGGDYGSGTVGSSPGATWTISVGSGGSGGIGAPGFETSGQNGLDGSVTISWTVATPHGFPGIIRSSLDYPPGPCWIDEKSRRKEIRA